jgi:hypothetical protein
MCLGLRFAAVADVGGMGSGGEGIRTLKPLRAPVFETGALPFCHPSEGSRDLRRDPSVRPRSSGPAAS